MSADEFDKCECTDSQCCSFDFNRRDFLRVVGGSALAALSTRSAMGADEQPDGSFIPADKKLAPDWIKSLFERGAPEVYKGAQLKYIKFPIGGICAGQVYLCGHGGLAGWWLSDFKRDFKQGFTIRTVSEGKSEVRHLDERDFPDMTFRGEYPIAKLDYLHASMPVSVSLEAFSPFIPLDAADSGLPATIFNFTLKNHSASPVEVSLAGSLQNGVCDYNRFSALALRRNRIIRNPGLSVLDCTAELEKAKLPTTTRPDIDFENWSKTTFEGWKVEGTAFGDRPYDRRELQQKRKLGELGGPSKGVACSYSNDPKGTDIGVGKLTSKPFTIDRRFINVWIGGGDLEGKTCVNLVVDGKIVISQTGSRDHRHSLHIFDTRALEGKQATIVIVDDSESGWGQISVGGITFSDTPGDGTPLVDIPDYGSMALALLGAPAQIGIANSKIGLEGESSNDASVPLPQPLIGTIGRTIKLNPGESSIVTFVMAWNFQNVNLPALGKSKRYYSNRFENAQAVAAYVATNLQRLESTTRLWRDTWYDSTLPYWFLDREFVNTSTLATGGCYRLADGRFYAFESGSGCCPGTCTHVWQYAHSMARVFPELERDTRERVDLGVGLNPNTGVIGFRGEYDKNLAVDGQCGTILRFYREHQMSSDSAFLKRNWEKIKTTFNPLFALDKDETGILDGAQMNTLDQPWFGQIAWMSSMYVAALRAGEAMANEMGDTAFADHCRKIAENGTKNIPAKLYNGEYFINILDPKNLNTVNSNTGSYIDQVYGQSWAFQTGLPRVLPEKETRSALQSLWKYNFSPDAGSYFKYQSSLIKKGRKYVSVGDAGMIMCSFPNPDWDIKKAGGDKGYAYYLIECWTGNEHQVASHMLWEGMPLEAMSMEKAIHERYSPNKRNPYSEVECGDHYSRAMASYGTYIAACGFEYHGPKKQIGFAPRITPDKFRAAFIAAEGWGTFAQSIAKEKMTATLEIKWGKLPLQSLALDASHIANATLATVKLAGQSMTPKIIAQDKKRILQFPKEVILLPGQILEVELG